MTDTSKIPTDDVVYAAGEFTGTDGKKRRRYDAIGVAWRDDQGGVTRLRLSALPISWDGTLFLRSRSREDGDRKA